MSTAPAGPTADRAGVRTLEVLATGPLATYQDRGRPGLAAMGVSRSGAADRGAYELGNRLLLNDPGTPAVEVTFGGLSLRARQPLMLALSGAECPARVDGRAVANSGLFYMGQGQVLTLGLPSRGLRTYLGVRGGFDVEPVLGSASTDTLSGLGPAPLAVGDILRVHPPRTDLFAGVDTPSIRLLPEDTISLDVVLGPRDDWQDDLRQLTDTPWLVSAKSNRVGVRLENGVMRRSREVAGAELASEGVVRGSIQVPASGEPIIFGADHPVTGGYPVVGVLTEESADLAAQARPGQHIAFRIVR